ncbi:MOSC domain-containing protein [Eubacteriales bacterium OttesenSCG-928-K08]|nr:MOSC domain-containing protein [Eubacteriales bacterium OttesenSCG-928-K08]
MGIVKAICFSEKKGTEKKEITSATFVADHGMQSDAHSGNWHRQVSLLSDEKVQAFRARGADVAYGAFGENIVVEGIDFRSLPVGTRLQCADVLLEMTQIGKECHTHCAIYNKMGDCIMPREGVFAKVLKGGVITVGEEMIVAPYPGKRPYQAAVITLSDKGARGEREDVSGPVIARRLGEAGYEVVETLLISDERAGLEAQLIRLCDQRQLDLIITTGGTGFAPRDMTPEATLAVADRLAPGIAEAIRAHSMKITPRGMLSRGVSALRGKTLIVNLPGSPKAVAESMDCFLDTLPHALDLLRGSSGECAR